MHTFSMTFLITKAGSSLPWWKRCTHAVLCLFEEIPVAHSGFPHTHSHGLSKRNPVSFLKLSKKNSVSSIPNCLLRRHTEACSPFSWRSRRKTKQQERSQIRLFFPSKAGAEFLSDNERHIIYYTYVAYKVNAIKFIQVQGCARFHKGHCGSRHSFSPGPDG